MKGMDFNKPEQSADVAAFCGGVFRHLSGLLVFTTGSELSFKRIQPSHWSGAYRHVPLWLPCPAQQALAGHVMPIGSGEAASLFK